MVEAVNDNDNVGEGFEDELNADDAELLNMLEEANEQQQEPPPHKLPEESSTATNKTVVPDSKNSKEENLEEICPAENIVFKKSDVTAKSTSKESCSKESKFTEPTTRTTTTTEQEKETTATTESGSGNGGGNDAKTETKTKQRVMTKVFQDSNFNVLLKNAEETNEIRSCIRKLGGVIDKDSADIIILPPVSTIDKTKSVQQLYTKFWVVSQKY
jgi:hypothetical protein